MFYWLKKLGWQRLRISTDQYPYHEESRDAKPLSKKPFWWMQAFERLVEKIRRHENAKEKFSTQTMRKIHSIHQELLLEG